MISFKWTGFSHVSMSTLVCQIVCLFLTTFSFSYAQKFQEVEISLIYQKLKVNGISISSLHISS